MISYSVDNQGVDRCKLHLIALSGGCDSVSLLYLLHSEQLRLHAVHCNFHLRGEEADRDMRFCQTLCNTYGIPISILHFDTAAYAQDHHIGIEMAARELRYKAFAELREELGADKLFVGSQADDVLETFFINLFRSTGIEGMKGIEQMREYIVRPLLNFTRDDILEYAAANKLAFVEDCTNADEHILRNAIRHTLIPTMEQIVPHARQAVMNTVRNVQDVLPLLHDATKRAIGEIVTNDCISLQKLQGHPSPEWLLFNILRQYNFTPSACRAVYENLDAQQGKRWESETHLLLKHEDCLMVSPKLQHRPISFAIEAPGTYTIPESGTLEIERVPASPDFEIPHDGEHIALDADTVTFPLKLCTAVPGMRFAPFGMNGTKLINDYLAEHGIPMSERGGQLLLTTGGNVAWLVGFTIANPFRITSKTKEILLCSFHTSQS